MPLKDGCVTDVEVWKNRTVYTTAIVPNERDDIPGNQQRNNREKKSSVPEQTHPELFTLTLNNAATESSLRVKLTYFSPLQFVQGRYALRIPLTLPENALNGKAVSSVVSVRCKMSTASEKELNLKDLSMPVKFTPESTPQSLVFYSDNSQGYLPNCDFTASYEVWSSAINSVCLVQPPEYQAQHHEGKSPAAAQSPQGMFGVSIAPPSPDAMRPFVRSVVFCIDKSGSMSGQPMASANKALLHALHNLAAEDEFEIIAFNHQAFPYSGIGLRNATDSEKKSATTWIQNTCLAGGLTNIMQPMCMACDCLSAASGIPYVFLITDGAVSNERDICREAQLRVGPNANTSGMKLPRISTFGIGKMCNHYFLKQLATEGRGINDAAFTHQRIEEKMQQMLDATARPVLADVTFGIASSAQNVELYPHPLPDLYSSQPVIVSGRYTGVLPEHITIAGRLPDGSQWEQKVQVFLTGDIPLQKVFAKQQIDLLSAQAWLKDDAEPQAAAELRKRVQTLSVQQMMPSPHTSMVAFETPQKKYQQEIEQKKKSGNGVSMKTVGAAAIGGAASVAVIGIATGGFGSIAGTADNVASVIGSAGPALGDFAGDAFSGCAGCAACVGPDSCPGCGGCEIMAAPCAGCDQGCTECFGTIGAGFSECFNGIGECFSSIPWGDIGEGFMSCVEGAGELIKSVLS